MLVYRPILIETDCFVAFCLAKNISPAGMMIRLSNDCTVGSEVKVHFSDFDTVTGSISWSNEEAIGIKFDASLDLEQMLAQLNMPRRKGKVSRGLRLKIDVKAEIVREGRTVPVELIDISQKGVKLRSQFLNQGDEVVVYVAGLDPRKAIAKWTRDGMAGLNFLRPIDFNSLGEWAIRAQTRMPVDEGAVKRERPA